ncbi:MAG: hypothetical protein KAT04_15005 [Methylococcales bacterium]|nr:hypothetical protein [Methylococcales bacterium]
MKEDDPLLEWNRLNKENLEQDFVSEMFINMSSTSPLADKFSIWLFAGTGATGALLISQIQGVIQSLSTTGFKVCMFMLIASAISAFFAKYWALRCQIQTDITRNLKNNIREIFEKHGKNADEISEIAEKRGIEIETEIQLENVINEFKKPFPFWVRWLITRSVSKTKNNRQAGYHVAIKAYFWQLNFTLIQSLFFIAFLCFGGLYASSL